MSGPPSRHGDWWVDNVFRPLALAIMAGCVAASVVELVNVYLPSWSGLYLILGCVLAALEGCYSYRLIRAKEIRGDDLLRFRAIELALFFILLKMGRYAGARWSDILAELRTWPHQPLNIIDPATAFAFLLALACWWAATRTLEDLERIGEPPVPHHSYVPPAESIANRFFWGGGVLLLISGLARLGISSLLHQERPPVPTLVLNVLLYFLLGLAMLSQVHFIRLRHQWEAQRIRIGTMLAGRWVRYSLAFIGLATILAFLLPTGYTVGLLDVVGYFLFVLGYYLSLLGMLFTMLLSLLLTPLFRLLGMGPRPAVRLPPLERMGERNQGEAGMPLAWFELLKSLLFWTIALGLVVYVVRSYLNDRPELLRMLAALKPIRALATFLEAVWRRLRGFAGATRARLPRLFRDTRDRAAARERPLRLLYTGRRTPRERIMYYYLSILERASRLGFPRHRAQTPYEYEQSLGPHLDKAQQDMGRLTRVFVEARYSTHPMGWEEEKTARTWWQNIKTTLRALHGARENTDAEESAELPEQR